MEIVDLRLDTPELTDQASRLLLDAFRNRSHEWQDFESARQEVLESVASERISLVFLDDSKTVRGWIGGIPAYGGHVWEVHPLVVAASHRRRGIGRALVDELARLAGARGGLTLWAGADDEHNETTLGGRELYPDIADAIRTVRNLRGHPYEFYLRLGFVIAGVLPDANGRGKPDIFLARRVGGP